MMQLMHAIGANKDELVQCQLFAFNSSKATINLIEASGLVFKLNLSF